MPNPADRIAGLQLKALLDRHARGELFSEIARLKDPQERRKAQLVFERCFYPPALRRKEGTALRSAWIEYGYLTPLDRDALFLQEYIAAYRRSLVRRLGPRRVRLINPLDPNLGRNHLTQVVHIRKARQVADELGIPYDLFLDLLMEGKVGSGQWRRPPQPNQLLSGRHSRARLRGRPTWPESHARLLGPTWDERFRTWGGDLDPIQERLRLLIRGAVLSSPTPDIALKKYLEPTGPLSIERATAMFGRDMVDAAAGTVSRPGGASTPAPSAPYVPACIGHLRSGSEAPVCGGCTVRTACKSLGAIVVSATRRQLGTNDPRQKRVRLLARERQRRRRKGLKSGPASHPGGRMSRSP